ncbi:flagellar biosynthesis regulator FlaF [Roseospira goensis]|uniref:Flagellar biosynthesis regulator FlaF n=1 Tax=Roseospira goensis TaxID=391922 RepID=A0A7W6S194_9PROT|nr:flagellar biosynthesis regulator FlaF [Roseospira goensis]MBB4287043.1 flagellar biosynthesis regulator FlaF [Roseospira goensis]
MTDESGFTAIEEEASALAQVALALSNARAGNDLPALSAALDTNLRLWIGIRTLASREDSVLPPEVRDNLIRLSRYVSDKSAGPRDSLSDEDLDAMINANLQISEGLLESQARGTA